MLDRVRAHLAAEGLHIVLPLGAAAFDREAAAVGAPAMSLLLEGASGAVVVGDGGPEFFRRFGRDSVIAGPSSGHPLDDHTRRSVGGAVGAALDQIAGVRHRIIYPFDGGDGGLPSRPLPFQRLGRAAGLGEAGPLGIQVHPRFGPWWAYRAVVLLAGPGLSIEAEAPLAAPCLGCEAPCTRPCPGHAVVAGNDFAITRCASHRLTAEACATSCAARLACPVGADHRYPAEQLAFHMTASLTQIRASRHRLTG